MITVGLDFGTHQSKVCIENVDGNEKHYTFLTFPDCNGKHQYTLPSIIQKDDNGYLKYGYIPKGSGGKIIRYFKQGAFAQASNMPQMEAIHYSIWYLTYIIFELEKMYGKEFLIQMGVPTDGNQFYQKKILAVRILLSAYHLAEEVFKDDINLFLRTPISELQEKTKLLPYDVDRKDYFGIQILPEAYACLMPLINKSKISGGMALMVDIGGGTTDISFFSVIEKSNNKNRTANERLNVYDFYSIDKGLNFLSDADNLDAERLDSNIAPLGKNLKSQRKKQYHSEINTIHNHLISKIRAELKRQSTIPLSRLMNALNSRPIIFTGGGSMFGTLRRPYGEFKDVIHISHKEWQLGAIKDIKYIASLGLCPILCTAYGLSMHIADDNVPTCSFDKLFEGVRDIDTESNILTTDPYNSTHEDWDTIK